MFYNKEMIYNMGFESVDAFVEDYIRKHPNCCVRFIDGGVFADYDYYTDPGFGYFRKLGLPTMLISPTVKDVVQTMIANDVDEETIKLFVATYTNEDLKYKALMGDGTLLDYEVRDKETPCSYGELEQSDFNIEGFIMKADYVDWKDSL